MLFNSLNFSVFLPLVFILYWFVANNNLKLQNILLLISSYFFYSCWDWRFLGLLLFSSLLDYYTGIKIFISKNKKKWLLLSILINIGILVIFKYFNFFINSFEYAFNLIGIQTNTFTLNLILPIGISFYTFHGLSYVIDIYNKKIKPEINFINYALFVSFFPLLVAGPIERATHLLPQIITNRTFNYSKTIDGLKQILWGLFKKIVVADNCAEFANLIFESHDSYTGSTLIIGAVFFSFQIYGDFSGYSDIALGTARLFGIELLKNFSFPYFSRNIAEFWKRWHISLSSWFRDYLYIPLGGSKKGKLITIRNTFIIFIVSGFWHGANWTFIIWGLLNALYFLPSLFIQNKFNNTEIVAKGKFLPSVKDIFNIIVTFGLTVFAWILFRANNLEHAVRYISNIFSLSTFSIPEVRPLGLIIIVCFFMFIEWLGRENNYAISTLMNRFPIIIRWSFYYLIVLTLILFEGKTQQFIYFQF